MRTILHDAGSDTALSLALLTGTYSEPEDFVRQVQVNVLGAHRLVLTDAVGQVGQGRDSIRQPLRCRLR